ncbi:hypothetical protein NHX12_025924 [Muraenolepis orangiensis]|uniref:PPC domain-containing protein n=1 Tax=Muraenolepis orangiensis TaxID=630683 RepID=A0A9Q0IQ97_9TELE|nr:hypothetical protein NHX12_025924 [Muraenolepis orangiensis]
MSVPLQTTCPLVRGDESLTPGVMTTTASSSGLLVWRDFNVELWAFNVALFWAFNVELFWAFNVELWAFNVALFWAFNVELFWAFNVELWAFNVALFWAFNVELFWAFNVELWAFNVALFWAFNVELWAFNVQLFWAFNVALFWAFKASPPGGAGGSGLRVHAVRFGPGQELKSGLLAFVEERGLRAPFILTCVGSVIHLKERYEIVSLVGTLNHTGHLHICLADSAGRTVGGHVMGDLEVFTTAEVVVGDATDLRFAREMDPATGFPELVVRPASPPTPSEG